MGARGTETAVITQHQSLQSTIGILEGMDLQRRSIRVKPDPCSPIEVHIIGETFLETLTAIDISISGIGLRAPLRLKDLKSKVCIKIPKFNQFAAMGKIIPHSINDQYIGIEFTRILSKDVLSIQRYVDYRLNSAMRSMYKSERETHNIMGIEMF